MKLVNLVRFFCFVLFLVSSVHGMKSFRSWLDNKVDIITGAKANEMWQKRENGLLGEIGNLRDEIGNLRDKIGNLQDEKSKVLFEALGKISSFLNGTNKKIETEDKEHEKGQKELAELIAETSKDMSLLRYGIMRMKKVRKDTQALEETLNKQVAELEKLFGKSESAWTEDADSLFKNIVDGLKKSHKIDLGSLNEYLQKGVQAEKKEHKEKERSFVQPRDEKTKLLLDLLDLLREKLYGGAMAEYSSEASEKIDAYLAQRKGQLERKTKTITDIKNALNAAITDIPNEFLTSANQDVVIAEIMNILACIKRLLDASTNKTVDLGKLFEFLDEFFLYLNNFQGDKKTKEELRNILMNKLVTQEAEWISYPVPKNENGVLELMQMIKGLPVFEDQGTSEMLEETVQDKEKRLNLMIDDLRIELVGVIVDYLLSDRDEKALDKAKESIRKENKNITEINQAASSFYNPEEREQEKRKFFLRVRADLKRRIEISGDLKNKIDAEKRERMTKKKKYRDVSTEYLDYVCLTEYLASVCLYELLDVFPKETLEEKMAVLQSKQLATAVYEKNSAKYIVRVALLALVAWIIYQNLPGKEEMVPAAIEGVVQPQLLRPMGEIRKIDAIRLTESPFPVRDIYNQIAAAGRALGRHGSALGTFIEGGVQPQLLRSMREIRKIDAIKLIESPFPVRDIYNKIAAAEIALGRYGSALGTFVAMMIRNLANDYAKLKRNWGS